MKLDIVQLEHVALSVQDLDRSIAFYRDLLGFSILRIIEPREDDKLGIIIGQPQARARIAHLIMGANMLELFQYIEPRGRAQLADHCQADQGFSHMGFRTRNTCGDYAQLKTAGVVFISEPVEFRPGAWVTYFQGPDGEVCELRQDDQAPYPGDSKDR